MLTVAVYINDRVILVRSCRRTLTGKDYNTYKVDDGRTILHQEQDGAIKLAIELLDGIHNIDEGGR